MRAAQFPYQDSYIDPVSGESTQVDSTCTAPAAPWTAPAWA